MITSQDLLGDDDCKTPNIDGEDDDDDDDCKVPYIDGDDDCKAPSMLFLCFYFSSSPLLQAVRGAPRQ